MLDKIIDRIPENNRLERIWLMAKFDFVTRYYGSFLGLFWALLKPLFQLIVFFIVFTTVFKNSTEKFLLFLFIGIIMFQFFTESATVSMNIFKTKRYLLENIQINKLDIFYSAIGATFLGFIFNFMVFALGNLLLNDTFSWSILFFDSSEFLQEPKVRTDIIKNAIIFIRLVFNWFYINLNCTQRLGYDLAGFRTVHSLAGFRDKCRNFSFFYTPQPRWIIADVVARFY